MPAMSQGWRRRTGVRWARLRGGARRARGGDCGGLAAARGSG